MFCTGFWASLVEHYTLCQVIFKIRVVNISRGCFEWQEISTPGRRMQRSPIKCKASTGMTFEALGTVKTRVQDSFVNAKIPLRECFAKYKVLSRVHCDVV